MPGAKMHHAAHLEFRDPIDQDFVGRKSSQSDFQRPGGKIQLAWVPAAFCSLKLVTTRSNHDSEGVLVLAGQSFKVSWHSSSHWGEGEGAGTKGSMVQLRSARWLS
ncbi:predicted protein [Histoplasma capsulatum H143]|uniref:Uncharacterized protein n=1 Tax=Ajellomyces capsulatus (strain H143) TaxID=544712 RepID=C6H7Y0_AJECH|nr:predicted protein [Histoplasma capsulatum H143]